MKANEFVARQVGMMVFEIAGLTEKLADAEQQIENLRAQIMARDAAMKSKEGVDVPPHDAGDVKADPVEKNDAVGQKANGARRAT